MPPISLQPAKTFNQIEIIEEAALHKLFKECGQVLHISIFILMTLPRFSCLDLKEFELRIRPQAKF
jgi:hypothetical protein